MKISIVIIAALAAILAGCLQSPDIYTPEKTILPPENITVIVQIPTPEMTGNLLIDNISRDLTGFNEKGWNKLYVSNEFDCSRMTTFMWDYLRKNYRVPPKIIVAPDRSHAWLAVRVKDAGDTDRYLRWTIKGVDYYYIESTVPEVVKFEKGLNIGGKLYSSSSEFYTTRIFVADDPSEANTLTGDWSTEFRLTKPDIDKLGAFK